MKRGGRIIQRASLPVGLTGSFRIIHDRCPFVNCMVFPRFSSQTVKATPNRQRRLNCHNARDLSGRAFDWLQNCLEAVNQGRRRLHSRGDQRAWLPKALMRVLVGPCFWLTAKLFVIARCASRRALSL